ncbi:MAG: DUF2142 domain-containing protein [Lachnospiraceae bacterium]|nr:DUF2142 domain-containing protein [Lachnospiraceae bacterium]
MLKNTGWIKGIIWKVIYVIVCLICCVFIFESSYSVFKTRTVLFDSSGAYELRSGEIMTQEISGCSGNLKNIYIQFATSGRINNGQMKVRLLKESEAVHEWLFGADELKDNAYKKFTLPHYYTMDQDSSYSIQIEERYEGENAVAVYLSSRNSNLTGLDDNGRLADHTVCYQLESIGLKETRVFQCVLMLVLLVFFILLGTDKRVKNILKIIIAVVIALFVSVIILDLFERINTEVPIIKAAFIGEKEEVQAGESKTYNFSDPWCEFDVLEVFFEADNVNGMHVALSDASTGELIDERYMDENTIVTDASSGRNAVMLSPGHSMEKGGYVISVDNGGTSSVFLNMNGGNLDVMAIKYTRIGIYMAILVMMILAAYISVLVLLTRRDKPLSPVKFFLISVIALGLCHYILFLPWSMPDTNSHYPAVYRLSNMLLGFPEDQEWTCRAEDGRYFVSVSRDFRPQIRSYADTAYNFTLFCRDDGITDFPANEARMKFYSILCYWPQTLGLTLGRVLGLSAIACAYLARLGIFIFYVWGCCHAVRVTPVGKSIFAFIALMPMPLSNSSGISYDPLVFITTMNFTASVLALNHKPASKKLWIEAMIWAFMVGGTKGGGYLILLPLVVLLFDRTKIKESSIRCLSIIGSGVFSVLLFNKLLQVGNALFQFGAENNGNMSTMDALRDPIRYLQMSFLTYISEGNDFIFDLIGTNLAWVERTVPAYVLAGLALIVIIYAVMEKDELTLDKRHKYVFVFIIALLTVTLPAMLLSFTYKGARMVLGLQGRYYLPIHALILLLLTKFSLHQDNLAGMDGVKECVVKNRLIYIYGLLSCLAVYYMMRMYLLR